jgi:hypothetical protein
VVHPAAANTGASAGSSHAGVGTPRTPGSSAARAAASSLSSSLSWNGTGASSTDRTRPLLDRPSQRVCDRGHSRRHRAAPVPAAVRGRRGPARQRRHGAALQRIAELAVRASDLQDTVPRRDREVPRPLACQVTPPTRWRGQATSWHVRLLSFTPLEATRAWCCRSVLVSIARRRARV